MDEPAGFESKWRPPSKTTEGPQVMIYNSLSRSKVPLIPMDPKGRSLTMYVCGPTVYDVAHLGHAHKFPGDLKVGQVAGFDVTYVMNVTDVDDKIIVRSRERGVTTEALARDFEAKFLQDMATLQVERPTAMPRVTEYMEEIVAYVAKIIENGFGYDDGSGSVYFDTAAFAAAGYNYAKLVPENVGSAELMAEGEGKLSNIEASKKRDAKDFALWKASKPGEPKWPSPWGDGRPGWHIECSAMIEASIGKGRAIDIHGGGIDLRFPHHDNELAQSEAFCRCNQTVNYFAHTGHLHIRGLKMSKSLKNFVSIAQALRGIVDEKSGEVVEEGVRPSTMRLMFCQVKYNAPCDYSDDMLANARAVEKKFKEFFHNTAAALRRLDADTTSAQRWSDTEHALHDALVASRAAFRERLFDDFDTPGALLTLQALVDASNSYLQSRETANSNPVSLIIAATARFVHDSLCSLGITGFASEPAMFTYAAGSYAPAGSPSSAASLAPLLDTLAKFREEVRRAPDLSAILALCDTLRDDILPDLGVRLEDKASGSVWKLDDPNVLRAERARKLSEAKAKADKKAADAKARAEKEAQKLAASLVPPENLFKNSSDLYLHFNEDGIPTHDAHGQPLSKNAIKSLKKAWEKQKVIYEKAIAQQKAASSPATQ